MKLSVVVHPNSKKPRIENDLMGTLHVYVNAPAMEGRANLAVIRSLSEHFGVPKTSVSLLSGFKAKMKVFEIKDSH